MAHIDYYFSTFSPFTYLAGTRMEDVATKHGATVTYKPIDLVGLFGRTGGLPPGQRHISRQEIRLQEMRRQNKKLGMSMNMKPAHFPRNAAPSAYAVIAAQNAGGGDLAGLSHAFLRACWVEDKDIAQDDVIQQCLTDNGFDAGLAMSGMLVGAETYAANLEDAVKNGVFGAPFYVVDGTERFWGQDRIVDLDAYLSGEL